MSRPRPAKPVNLFMSLIGSDRETIGAVLLLLMERFGEADYIGPCREFSYTDYYEQEMGPGLRRREKDIDAPKEEGRVLHPGGEFFRHGARDFGLKKRHPPHAQHR